MAHPGGGPLAARIPRQLLPGGESGQPRQHPPDLDDDGEWSGLAITGDFSDREADRFDVSECRVTGAAFTASTLEQIRITDAVFVGCDLSGATLHEATLIRVEFHDCRMLGFSAAQAQLRDVLMAGCRLADADFRMSGAERIQFDGCDLAGADLYAARWSDASFFDSDLTRAEFSKASLINGRLHGSTLTGLRGASYLRGVTIDSVQVVPMALQVFGSLGIVVDDEREPRGT